MSMKIIKNTNEQLLETTHKKWLGNPFRNCHSSNFKITFDSEIQ